MFGDLYGYARWNAAPDRRVADESRIVAAAGDWAGRVLLGESVGAAILAAARSGPVTVRVLVPAGLERVLTWPLELAHVDGIPLAARGDVTLVYDIGQRDPAPGKAEVSGALRVLAVFSQPTRTGILALRRERYALARLIRRIATRQRAALELRVVQYGVTRERLAEIIDSGDGWDVLHLSGHGNRGLFLLEHADGSPDPVDTAGLLKLLRPGRRRAKLAVLSACESAADSTAETLRLAGLMEQADAVEVDTTGPAVEEVAGLARALVQELDCAVVAMRYPVTDEFAIAFGDVFYERLLARGQPVDVAAARAAAEAIGPRPSAARPAVSLATPGVFGARAAGLALKPPHGKPVLDPAQARMAYFPPEPAQFVGRAAAMAAASSVLAPSSGRTTVLLHGMAGAGKTACALELAYRHADGFGAAAFWQAPTKDEEWASALPSLAAALEVQLGDYGFAMTGHIGTDAGLKAFLPRLRQVLEDGALLLVLDNLETLLTPDGAWRDPRWGSLITALSGHDGESRLILTSRIPPAGLGAEALMLPVHALSLDEAAALARELPNLRGLLHSDVSPVRAQAAVVEQDRDRVRRVLHVVQGHPKLLELADAAAADRDRLDAHLSVAEKAAGGQGLDAFFRDGVSALGPEGFLTALSGWTTTALTVLPEPVRLMAQFLACIEDEDRRLDIVGQIWQELWRLIGQGGDPPDPEPLLEALGAAALVQPEALLTAADGAGQREGAPRDAPLVYRIHPGVAAAIAEVGGAHARDAADTALAAFWTTIAVQELQDKGSEDSGLIARAGLAAAPYLMRRGDWRNAGTLLGIAIERDDSPGTIQAALPMLRRIAAATGSPKDYGVLASALRRVDPAESETLLRELLARAVDSGDWRIAATAAGELANMLGDAGRLDEALEMTTQKGGYTRQAGLGPWTQLLDQVQRLQILGRMGEHRQVLAQTDELQAWMRKLPVRSVDDEAVNPWNVREVVLGIGHGSALTLGEWQRCLELNAEIVTSKRQRGAAEHEITCFRFNDAGALIRLGRLNEAGRLLRECQQVFEEHRDITRLALVFGTRAELENALGHPDTAAELTRTALRLRYARPAADLQAIAVSHHNLANCLRAGDTDPAGQRAHQLAAAILFRLAGMAHDFTSSQHALADDLHVGSNTAGLPATVAEVVEVAGQTDGVRLGELIAALEPDASKVEEALGQILRSAAELAPNDADSATHPP